MVLENIFSLALFFYQDKGKCCATSLSLYNLVESEQVETRSILIRNEDPAATEKQRHRV